MDGSATPQGKCLLVDKAFNGSPYEIPGRGLSPTANGCRRLYHFLCGDRVVRVVRNQGPGLLAEVAGLGILPRGFHDTDGGVKQGIRTRLVIAELPRNFRQLQQHRYCHLQLLVSDQRPGPPPQ